MQTLKELNLPHWSQRSPIYSTIIPAIPGTDLALNQFLKGISPSYQDPGKHKTVCILYPSLYCIISLLSKITALYKQNVQIYLVYFFFLAPKEIIKNIKLTLVYLLFVDNNTGMTFYLSFSILYITHMIREWVYSQFRSIHHCHIDKFYPVKWF